MCPPPTLTTRGYLAMPGDVLGVAKREALLASSGVERPGDGTKHPNDIPPTTTKRNHLASNGNSIKVGSPRLRRWPGKLSLPWTYSCSCSLGSRKPGDVLLKAGSD